jgi:hypothetical protein
MLRLAGTLIATLSLALALTVRVENHRVEVARARAAEAALASSNLVAERDSTRTVARVFGESLTVAQRRVMQVAQRNDALDAALGAQRLARYALSASVDSLEQLVAAASTRDPSHALWLASFALRQPPYTIRADVEFPEPPDSAQLDMRVQLDSIHVDARVACSPPNEHGVKSASITASTPPWARLRFDRVEQSPDLCASPALARRSDTRRLMSFAPLVLGAGRIVASRGPSAWGAFVGAGIQLWN